MNLGTEKSYISSKFEIIRLLFYLHAIGCMCYIYFCNNLTLYQTTIILDWSKLKALADDKLNAIEKLKFGLGRVENMMGKGLFLRGH